MKPLSIIINHPHFYALGMRKEHVVGVCSLLFQALSHVKPAGRPISSFAESITHRTIGRFHRTTGTIGPPFGTGTGSGQDRPRIGTVWR